MRAYRLIRRSLFLLSRRDRFRLALVVLAQSAASFLDLFGVLLLGLVASMAASKATDSVFTVPAFFGPLASMNVSLVTLAAVAGAALAAKSILNLFLLRRTFRFLAHRQAIVAGNLAQRLLTGSILEIQRRTSIVTAHTLTTGVNIATVGILGPGTVILSELTLCLALTFGLIFVDPFVALFTLVFFGLLVIVQALATGKWAHRLGIELATSEIESVQTLTHAIRAYRELSVGSRRGLFVRRFVSERWATSMILADQYVLSQIGKYVFEIGLVVGGGLLVVTLTLTRSVAAAIGVLTVFLLATTRLMPSLLRIQSAIGSIRVAEGLCSEVFVLAAELDTVEADDSAKDELAIDEQVFASQARTSYPGFQASLLVQGISFSYPHASQLTIDDASLALSPGESLAFVGPTGSGKSTLADLCLGLLNPTSGSVTISGMTPKEAARRWPGSLAYVPQDVAILDGTIRENVALGLSREQVDDDMAIEALSRARLHHFLSEMREGLDTFVGEHGVKLSGGQRQRLGLARALYSRPRFLVLDEATSALDAETEAAITQTLRELSGEVATIVIAHRLATIMHSDRVAYIEGGKIVANGTFLEVRERVPAFARQADILGL